MTTRIAVLGASGRMGRAIIRIISETPNARLAAAVERVGSPQAGQDAGALAGLAPTGVLVTTEAPAPGTTDVWIDFTLPTATIGNVKAAAAAGAGIVIGTTGLNDEQKQEIAGLAQACPVVLAPNMSVGVNVLLKLVADATRSLGEAYDIDIVEAHHKMKRDAPSGTALRLAEAAAEGRGVPLKDVACYSRHGDIGPRPAGEIGIQTLRGGDVVGDHTVFFFGPEERIEITHRASSRDAFARGAVRAAQWLAGRKASIYDMRDVLGLK
ncbi:MAG: 4-hydroxy-tetrahydrodipicolinate reductase [Deltaproteobacteria bacterium]|nr:4-hydroxy-tetrahydrodipicolinate reductase [Deltaproteobacteria bacterium]